MSKRKMIFTILVLAMAPFLFIISACSTIPQVRYIETQDKDFEGKIKFHLAKPSIVIKKKKGVTKVDSVDQIEAVVVAKEYDNKMYSIQPKRKFWDSYTHLNVKYFEKTKVIKNIGVEVQDNRVKMIESVGAIVAGMAGMATFSDDLKRIDESNDIDFNNLKLPTELKIEVTKLKTESEEMEFKLGTGWSCIFSLEGGKEKGSIPREEFFKEERYKGWLGCEAFTSVFAISSCQEATLKIQYKGKEVGKFNIKIPNPNYVQAYEFPIKGAIVIHSDGFSGADTETSDVTSTNAIQVIEKFVAEIKDVIEVYEESEESE